MRDLNLEINRGENMDYYLLENTLIVIHSEFDKEQGCIIVTKIENLPDRILRLPASADSSDENSENERILDFNIFPQDFPPRAQRLRRLLDPEKLHRSRAQ